MRSGEQIRTVGIVGVGAIGASWAAQVTGLGLDLVVHDVAEDPERLLRQAFDRIGPDYPAGRIRFVAGLSALAAASDLVIEAGPEDVELK